MNIKIKITLLLLFPLVLFISCSTTNQFMPSSVSDNVIGTVQTSFVTVDTWFNRDVINTTAYIMLLEEACDAFSGQVDIRDIIWATGKNIDQQNKEVVASGKVIYLE